MSGKLLESLGCLLLMEALYGHTAKLLPVAAQPSGGSSGVGSRTAIERPSAEFQEP